MSRTSDFKPGDGVVYRADVPGAADRFEDGVVTSVNDRYVFVRFTNMHPAAPGKACLPEHLVKS